MHLRDHPEMRKQGGLDTSSWCGHFSATSIIVPSMNAKIVRIAFKDANPREPSHLILAARENREEYHKTLQRTCSPFFFDRLERILRDNYGKTLTELNNLDIPERETVAEFMEGHDRGWPPTRHVRWRMLTGTFPPVLETKLVHVETPAAQQGQLVIHIDDRGDTMEGTININRNGELLAALCDVLRSGIGHTLQKVGSLQMPM